MASFGVRATADAHISLVGPSCQAPRDQQRPGTDSAPGPTTDLTPRTRAAKAPATRGERAPRAADRMSHQSRHSRRENAMARQLDRRSFLRTAAVVGGAT